jgi:hypothetical protein
LDVKSANFLANFRVAGQACRRRLSWSVPSSAVI